MKITVEAFGDTMPHALSHIARVLAMALVEPPEKNGDVLTCSCINGGAELKLEISDDDVEANRGA